MLGLFGKKGSSKKPLHQVDREDWEYFLDQIYVKTIQGKAGGIVLISNTSRASAKDQYGVVNEELTYRVKRNIDNKMSIQLKRFDFGKFNELFESLPKKSSENFFRTRKVFPSIEVLVYPLYQDDKRALVVLEASLPEANLSRAVANIESEINQA